MAFELDHLFVFCPPGGRVADEMVAAGFVEGPPNTHPGQGTACRRFFFDNAMFELLWVTNPEELKSEPIERTQLFERASNLEEGTSLPFGVALRPRDDEQRRAPFDVWSYRPPYLPEGWSILVSTSCSHLEEPFLFVLPQNHAPADLPPERRPPLDHPNGARRVERLSLCLGAERTPSRALSATLEQGFVEIVEGAAPFLEITLSGAKSSGRVSLLPDAPMALRW